MKELKNGRAAMLGIMAFSAAHFIPGPPLLRTRRRGDAQTARRAASQPASRPSAPAMSRPRGGTEGARGAVAGRRAARC